MKKNLEELYFSNDYTQFTSQTEKDNNVGKMLLKNFKHKNTASNIPTKLKKVETNIFQSYSNSITNNNFLKSNISPNINHFSPKKDDPKMFAYKRRSTLASNISNLSMNQNFQSDSFNLISFLNINTKNKGNNNVKILPNINSFDKSRNDISNITETTFKKINNNKDALFNKKLNNNNSRTKSVHDKKTPKLKFSTGNLINFSNFDKKEKIPSKTPKKFLKMKTFLNINNQIGILNSDGNLKSGNEEENEDNKDDTGKNIKNKKLLYSKKVNNYIFKIYKAVNTPKKFINNNNVKNTRPRNNKRFSNFSTIKYLNNFNPKNYINKIKYKIKNGNIGNSKEIKNKILEKSYDYLEYHINKINKNIKKKQNTLEKIKDKNRHYLNKVKNSIVNTIIDEISSKKKLKHKSTVFKLYIDSVLISQHINNQIHIKLNIMRHVLTKSEKDENLYFINLIKYLLYSSKKKLTIRYPLGKSFKELDNSLFKKTTTIDKYRPFNKKDIYYLSFSIKFKLLDCETMIRLPEERKLNLKNDSKKIMKIINTTIFIDNKSDPQSAKESENFSEVEKRIKKMSHRSKRLRKCLYLNKIKLTSSSKILNINLTKNIIKLRNEKNIEEALKSKAYLHLKNLKRLYKNKIRHRNGDSDSSDSFEYKKYSNKFSNNFILNNPNLELGTDRTIREDNEEIHQREKLFLFQHFIYYIEHSEYYKLLNWLKKSCKYMDLSYTFENGDTLLHLCVRNNLPHYIYKFLLHHGVNINTQNNDGDTALHLAVQNHMFKTIDFLVKMGASECIYNKMRKICWECL